MIVLADESDTVAEFRLSINELSHAQFGTEPCEKDAAASG